MNDSGATAKSVDICVIGGGAAGLFCAIHAARTMPGRRVLVVDGARRVGAKILVAGGGRCNVTHYAVDTRDFNGSAAAARTRVLNRYGVEQVVQFFREFGVELKREDTGKLFPVSDDAHSVLHALLMALRQSGAQLRENWSVESVECHGDSFLVRGVPGVIRARRVVLATGGQSLPKSGSDGRGYQLARRLGHTLTEPILPALVPLIVEESHWVRTLSGLSVNARVEVRSSSGKRLAQTTGSLLCTHFGLSGPAALDISRHLLMARSSDPAAALVVGWLPGLNLESADELLLANRSKTALALVREYFPERLARALVAAADATPEATIQQTPREKRRELARVLAECPMPIAGDRGFTAAEVTAGGVPLSEVDLTTMESRTCPGLHLCGEILDVDGRIGGFNFQWAWASGFVAGEAAARLTTPG